MSRPPPQPLFVHHGFLGGVTSCAVVSTEESKGVLVGTGAGKCELYDAETHLLIRTIYEDDEKRSISGVGEYNGVIWVHIRNHGVHLLGPGGEVQKTLMLGHCGYCKAITASNTLVYPDNKSEEHFLQSVDMTSGDRSRFPLKQLPLSLIGIDDSIFVGDEAGTVMRFSLQGKEEAQVSLFSEPVFSLAGTSTTLACGSSKPPLLLLETASICGERRKIDYPASARGVGAMVFSSTGKTLVAGFWDGSIRAYSVRKLAILVCLDFHTETITQLLWCQIGADDLLIAASHDEKLSLWKLK